MKTIEYKGREYTIIDETDTHYVAAPQSSSEGYGYITKAEVTTMKMPQIREAIKGLAASQGSYGRLDRILDEVAEESPETYAEITETLEQQGFTDVVDLIMYLEA